MISTIGEAWDQGWTITVRCAWGKRDAMKSIRECIASVDLDLETLVWAERGDLDGEIALLDRQAGPCAFDQLILGNQRP